MSTLSFEDRGFTLGDGVFDTALALGGVMIARERHVARLLSAAQTIGIAIEHARIDAAIDAALPATPAILRTTLTRGIAARGLWPLSAGEPTLLVSAAPWSPALLGQPARVVTATGRRNEFSPTASLKTLGYLDHILAAREAAGAGVDDALILNTQGRVACTTIANVFALMDDQLVTPPLSEGCLPGVMRALVLQIAPSLGLEVAEVPLTREALAGAQAAFATNSLRFLRPIVALDGVALGSAAVLDALEQALFVHVEAECGIDPRRT